MNVCVMGLGNIGQRHVQNLLAVGHEVLGYDVRVGMPEFSAGTVQATNALAHVWAWRPDAVVIATAPATHHELAWQVLAEEINCFIEKPIAMTVLEANDLIHLNDNRQTLAVGYQLLAMDSVRAFPKDWRALRIWDKQHMGAWPEARYDRDVLSEFSHELSLCLFWACSMPDLATITWANDENCLINLSWTDGRLATIELSANQVGYERGAWSDKGDWVFSAAENERAYADELDAFLVGQPYCTGEQALEVLRLIERLR